MSETQKLGFCRTSRLDDYQSLSTFVDHMISAVDKLIQRSLDSQYDGEFHFNLNSIYSLEDCDHLDTELLIEMLYDRPEVSRIYNRDGDIEICLADGYAKREDRLYYQDVTQDEADIICANHILWLHGLGGQQADFSWRIIRDINFAGRNLDHAIFTGASFIDCNLIEARMNHADLTMAKFRYCEAQDLYAKDANFESVFINESNFDGAAICDSNMYLACICGTSIADGKLDGSCIRGAMMGLRYPEPSKKDCSDDLQAWLRDHPDVGPKERPATEDGE